MTSPRITTFDGWLFRLDVGELSRGDRKIRLQDQPLQVLDELLAHPGELVTRDQLIARLWPKGVVDFDNGLNSAIRKLRVALQDEAETPRYIETIPRKGYRFIGKLDCPATETQERPAAASEQISPATPSALVEIHARTDTAAPGGRLRINVLLSVVGVAVMLGGLVYLALQRRTIDATATASLSSPPALNTMLGRRTIAILPLRPVVQGEASDELAACVTDLLRNRLAMLPEVTVIAGGSMMNIPDFDLEPGQIGERLHARYVLHGTAQRSAEQVRAKLELTDAASGLPMWVSEQAVPVDEVGALLEVLAGRVAATLKVPNDRTTSHSVAPRINLDAYRLYLRGQRLMQNQRVADTEVALELFRRATILDPGFARGYLALGQAHRLTAALRYKEDAVFAELQAHARVAYRRALELDPGLGEVWIERARLEKDPGEAEKLYREGLSLAPSYGVGYMRYAEFLFNEYRRGEAIEIMERALTIDPLTPRLLLRQADFMMKAHSDLEVHDRLVREALKINPQQYIALYELGVSRHEWSGEFAEGIAIMERAIVVDPHADTAKDAVARMYLDVADVTSATRVLEDATQPERALVEVAKYQRDTRRAAELARRVPLDYWTTGDAATEAEAIRDQAIATGEFSSALKLLEARYAMTGLYGNPGSPAGQPMWNRSLALVYAHTLVLAGEDQRGRRLANSVMAMLDSESVGRREHWLSRERSLALAILGENERALEELAASVKLKLYSRWWYTAELDPIYDRMRSDPRFQVLAEQARTHRVQQRATLDELRRKGEVVARQ